mgnify:FL=1
MNIQNWKIFTKSGSPLNWTADSWLHLLFNSPTGKNAEGYLITDPYGRVTSAKITNGGYYYDTVTASYSYAFSDSTVELTSTDASIITIDISIGTSANDIINTKSIYALENISIDASFIYPAVTYAGAIFLNPISVGLIETEHLFILEKDNDNYIRPYDASNSTLIVRMIGDETEISFFEVNEETSEITWTDELEFDLSERIENTALAINIGFKAEYEGVYERIIRFYHKVGNILYTLAEIAVSAEAIGEDERFRTLISNFGLPDPKDMKDIFKETDINEDLPDWEILNYKSKHIILEHDKIIPFIGTYKGLINAIRWLGYDDIYFREWFLNVKENKKLSLLVPYEASDRTQTILMFDADKRKALKKLNQLSMIYCLTRETGEIDNWGTPKTENCYSYNLKEIYIKLLGLKKWLERYIIGINCKIVDITGEGIYFERFKNLSYFTHNIGYEYKISQTLTPYSLYKRNELISGDASVYLSFLEITNSKIDDFKNHRFIDFADCAWNTIDSQYYSLDDPSYISNPSDFLLLGSTFKYPFTNINDIMWKISVEKDYAGVIGETLVTNPLFILENDIRFYNIYDVSSIFYDTSTSLTIYLEKAYLRDPSIDEWGNSVAYSIYSNKNVYINATSSKYLVSPKGTYTITSGSGTLYLPDKDPIEYNIQYDEDKISFVLESSVYITADSDTIITSSLPVDYYMETSSGIIYTFNDYITLNPDSNSKLQYAYDSNYKVPLLTFKNYKTIDSSNVIHNFLGKEYILDILDGKIEMNAGTVPDTSDNSYVYINFNYDTSIEEQKITMNVEYYSPRMKLFQIDPSIYYWTDPSGLTGGENAVIIDNSVYKMKVNHIGDYNVELFAWDDYNTLLYNMAKEPAKVWIKSPTLYFLVDNSSYMGYDVSRYMSRDEVNDIILKNLYPIYDRHIPLQGLSVHKDSNNRPYIIVPSITYFQDVPEENTFNRFYNMTERITSISGNTITIDNDYQKFYTDDDIVLVKMDKGKYSLILDASFHITSASGSNPVTVILDKNPVDFGIEIDSSVEIYALNDTYRTILNPSNYNDHLILDISGYQFEDNQCVALIVTDNVLSKTWGSTYRVINVNGSTHTFDNTLPELFMDTDRYTIKAKHAFSTYSSLSAITDTAIEVDNNFMIYLKDSYNQEHYLDNTFVYINTLFDEDRIEQAWYNTNLGLSNTEFYYYDKPIWIDTSTLVIIKAEYDPSNYLLNQKNIWTAKFLDGKYYFKVFNDVVTIVFDTSAVYTISVESYDKYGNIIEHNIQKLC